MQNTQNQQVMQNLLQIESNFLNLPQVATGLRLTEVKALNKKMATAHKQRFIQSVELGKIALASFEWFSSAEGQALCNEEGVSWNRETFADKVFGVKNSYFGKLLKVGGMDTEVVETFNKKCDEAERNNEKCDRSVAGLIKFAKAGIESSVVIAEAEAEGDVEETTEETTETTAECVFTITYKTANGNVALSIDSEGTINTANTNAQIREAIAFLNNQMNLF
jgi:hypothetical protein